MQALSNSTVEFKNLSTSDDTQRLKRSLDQIKICSDSRIPLVIDAGNAGTVFRFLTAYLSIKPGKWLLTGDPRIKERPVKDLVDALHRLGAKIRYMGRTGFPPLRIQFSSVSGGSVEVDASKSSQFITALMLIGPCLPSGIEMKLKHEPVSRPYIDMTWSLMQEFGISVSQEGNFIHIPAMEYQITSTEVEPDWSSASYWYEMVALANGAELFIHDLKDKSVQGDRVCADIFGQFGVETIFRKEGVLLRKSKEITQFFSYDFSRCPDLVPAVLTTCAAKNIRAEISGVEHLKYKESDRMESLKKELQKIGAELVQENKKYILTQTNTVVKSNLVFETYGDHRMAMCFAPLALKYDSIVIQNPQVVDKSYPDFWEDIQQLGLMTVDKN